MLEWIATLTAFELGKLALDQVLDLSKDALEDYVKDFFKDSIKAGFSKANAALLKKPMAEAIGVFIKRFVRELEINDVHPTSIDHFYRGAIRQYVNDNRVRPILGQAFEKGLRQIDWGALERIWNESYIVNGWMFPEEDFNWQAVAKEYLFEVRGIIKSNAELRSLLAIEIAEDVAADTKVIAAAVQQLVGLSAEFDLQGYRRCLLEQYGYLPLESLGSGMYEREGLSYRNIPLWNIFVVQDVRECQSFQPKDFDIPKELLRRNNEGASSESEVSSAVSMRLQEYGRQPKKSVCSIIGWQGLAGWNPKPDHKRLVILGDPGSGKSSLLRFLAVKWAQQDSSDNIPLLIELRHYMRSVQGQESKCFLDFIHHGSQWVGHLNRLELLNWLEAGKVILLLDGLDEVVDRQMRDTVLKQIHSFTSRFPKNIILITSRVHDYGSAIQQLSHAGFFHFKLEDLDHLQIQDFLERWHEATYGPGVDKVSKHDRLSQAIRHSKAIQELAANPLLLTLMAILNRAQELPRDRAHLYEKASEVLLHQWDVEAKLLQDPKLKNYPVEISFRDKRAMLRRIAFSMQNSSKGLAGNSITYSDLHASLNDYLKTVKQAHNAPSIAEVMIEQLRERNFAICFLGDDQYGFVHRTFLEYYCASEIRYRFEQQRSLEFNDLRDQVFGVHWRDQGWHEVLRLICGMIEPIFASQLIEHLIHWSDSEEIRTDALPIRKLVDYELATQYCRSWLGGLLLAAECCSEVSNLSAVSDSRAMILGELQSKINSLILNIDADQEKILGQVNSRVLLLPFIMQSVASWTRYPEVLPWLKQVFIEDGREQVRISVVSSIASNYKDDELTLPWLKQVFIDDEREQIRSSVVGSIASNYKEDKSTLPWLKQVFIDDEREQIRSSVVSSIASNYKDDKSTLPWLKQVFIDDGREQIRTSAVSSIASNYKQDELTSPWLKQVFMDDEREKVRSSVVNSIASNYKEDKSTLPWLKQVFIDDEREKVRSSVVNSIASNYKEEESTLPWLKQVFMDDECAVVRKTAFVKILSILKDESMPPWVDRVFDSSDDATLNVLTSPEVMAEIAFDYPHMIDWYVKYLGDELQLAKDAGTTPNEHSRSIVLNLKTFSSLGLM